MEIQSSLKRPMSILIISSYMIFSSAFVLVSLFLTFYLNAPHPIPDTLCPFWMNCLLSFVGAIVVITSCIGMIYGYLWARNLFILWNTVGMIFAFINNAKIGVSLPIVISTLLMILMIGVLCRPKMNRYFHG